MATALIHMDPKQKQKLARRAKARGRSFSQEVRNAVDMYLDLPMGNEAELAVLSKMANESADRSIARMDEAISYIAKGLKAMRKSR